jgi:hypothetical protein
MALAPFIEYERGKTPDEQTYCEDIEADQHERVDAVERKFESATAG